MPDDRRIPDPTATPAQRFGDAVRSRRRELGLTLETLAGRVDCTKGYLSLIENGRKGPPSAEVVAKLEAALFLDEGHLAAIAAWSRTPSAVREDVERLRGRSDAAERLAEIIRAGGIDAEGRVQGRLDAAYRTGELRELIDRVRPGGAEPAGKDVTPAQLPFEVPVINSMAAGYPADFTDLGYPARVADSYVRCPDIEDADAFAARVVGDSMEPDYKEGDIVVFSPARDVAEGDDCFARLEPDHESTFKRVYFDTGPDNEALIRLQPTNSRYAPRSVPREHVAGLYRAVSVIRSI